jgi:hypothetical protein
MGMASSLGLMVLGKKMSLNPNHYHLEKLRWDKPHFNFLYIYKKEVQKHSTYPYVSHLFHFVFSFNELKYIFAVKILSVIIFFSLN